MLLYPLSKAPRFVLIGDHLQLQPLVRSEEALSKGMAVSLFERLAAVSGNKTQLTQQYRMCAPIMKISNLLVYSNQLRCGNLYV